MDVYSAGIPSLAYFFQRVRQAAGLRLGISRR